MIPVSPGGKNEVSFKNVSTKEEALNGVNRIPGKANPREINFFVSHENSEQTEKMDYVIEKFKAIGENASGQSLPLPGEGKKDVMDFMNGLVEPEDKTGPGAVITFQGDQYLGDLTSADVADVIDGKDVQTGFWFGNASFKTDQSEVDIATLISKDGKDVILRTRTVDLNNPSDWDAISLKLNASKDKNGKDVISGSIVQTTDGKPPVYSSILGELVDSATRRVGNKDVRIDRYSGYGKCGTMPYDSFEIVYENNLPTEIRFYSSWPGSSSGSERVKPAAVITIPTVYVGPFGGVPFNPVKAND